MAARTTKKSFTSKRKNKEPIVFELEGEEFTARGYIAGAILLDYIEDTADMNNAQSVREYLKVAMSEEEYARFDAHSREQEVELETLNEVFEHLIEAQTSRPTEASSK
jgi:UDP-N-acetylglucosamine 2-epimerase